MKSLSRYLSFALILATLASCGKDNESGKGNYSYQSGLNGYGYNTITGTNYNYNGQNLVNIINQNPCTTGTQYRTTIQFPLTGFNSYLTAGEIYAGVTSYGDVAAVIGQNNNAPLFVAYVCQRGYTSGQGQLMDLALGSYSKCAFKQLTRATMYIPGSQVPLYFRMLEGGSSQGQKFSFCY